jgi:hypothetical protein
VLRSTAEEEAWERRVASATMLRSTAEEVGGGVASATVLPSTAEEGGGGVASATVLRLTAKEGEGEDKETGMRNATTTETTRMKRTEQAEPRRGRGPSPSPCYR